ncbi:60S ribosomal protein L14 [Hondaea fermentalgiana]|uniref:60S ribosomal protein L14 n=1 Tax=Hondaea fermentalgiana TaxID=2315210 RepID=A0A2R5GMY4_9STRA|nr:60S ribosomal protein L14 [Hondaea fermentalgiana]|eukprot:GBG31659.1 60S ribosomal protein L14 [Hondaea fermentalgiana]
MVFTKFVEVGRVVLINYGPLCGKLATIINVVDSNRVLIDGPEETTGVKRQVINIKRITLTDIKVTIGVQARAKSLKKALADADFENKWKESALARKLEMRRKRLEMNDFDRFKVMLAKKAKAKAVKKKFQELKASA